MSQIIDILDTYIDFSLRDKQALETLFSVGDVNNLTLSNITNVHHGSNTGASAGNFLLNLSDGLTLYNEGGARTCYLDPDGDVSFGSDIDSPSTTAFKVFSNAQSYNSEDFGEGDLLLGDNSSSKANLHWDQSTGQLKLRSGTTAGIILDTDGSMQSGNYSSEASGWKISADGDAEFNSVIARGAFRTSVFTYENIMAIAGHLIVSKSAGEVATDVTTATTFALEIKTDDNGGAVVATGDILEIKGWNGTELLDVFVTAGTVSTASGISSFTATLNSGGTGKALQRGMAAVNLGPSGAGLIRLQAGDLSDATVPTRISIQTHAGSPWSALTNQIVIGDMYGTYGASTNHRFGAGIGDYSGGNYLSYNAESAGGFVVKGGDGSVQIDETGLFIRATGIGSEVEKQVKFLSTDDEIMGYIDMYQSVSSYNQMTIKALDYDSRNTEMIISATGGIRFQGGGDFLFSAGNMEVAETIRSVGVSTTGYAGDGIEMYLSSSVGRILSYDRTGGHYLATEIRGDPLSFWEGGTKILTIDGGDVYTNDITNYAGTTNGWSSLTTKKIYVKTFGDWVFVQFELYGTANSATTWFNVPYNNNASVQAEGVMRGDDNLGAPAMGMCILPVSSQRVTLYRDPAQTAWSATGTKWVSGQFWYQRA